MTEHRFICLNNKGEVYYRRRPNSTKIDTVGVDYSGHITVFAEKGRYQIWKKASGSCWGGIGCDRLPSPTWYALVRIESASSALPIEGWEPGRQWRKCIDRLTAKLNELAAHDEQATR